jgi:two-component system KDP operon response regulator KdpE
MRQAGKVLRHRTILREVWGPEYGDETEYLRVYIGRLRQKLEPDPGNPRYLLTERGIGYSFSPHQPSS